VRCPAVISTPHYKRMPQQRCYLSLWLIVFRTHTLLPEDGGNCLVNLLFVEIHFHGCQRTRELWWSEFTRLPPTTHSLPLP
jgi:hypothetical protein